MGLDSVALLSDQLLLERADVVERPGRELGLPALVGEEFEKSGCLRGQALQALAQTLRPPHRSHNDRDGGIQFIALFTGSRHRNDKFAVFLSDKILGRIG